MTRWQRRLGGHDGFTLIELLVVVVIIGILSAIAVPQFVRQQEKAWDKAVQVDLRNNAVKMETFFDDNGAYPTTAQAVGVYSFTTSDSVGPTSVATSAADLTAGRFCLQATSQKIDSTRGNSTQHLASLLGRPADGPC